jgi:gluconate 2-dehydrogenase alpha chain
MSTTALKKTDVVIIGLGAAGGIAAYVLAKAGVKVVGLEAGPRLTPRDYPSDEMRQEVRNWMGRTKVNNELPTWRRNDTQVASQANTLTTSVGLMMNAVGGTSIHWSCWTWRLFEKDFAWASEIAKRKGLNGMPAGSTIADWPFSYAELEPYYDKAEYFFGASGKAGNIRGQVDAAGNVFEAPRQREFPLPPLRTNGITQLAMDAAKRLGWHPFITPAMIRSREYAGLPGCQYCGYCSRNGCHAGAKGSTDVRGIPEAEKTGNLHVVPMARVLQIDTDANGKATGVTYVKGRTLYFQPADVVLLATYTYENTRLLLLSKSRAFPNGLANNQGQVGKHFCSHTTFGVSGLFPGAKLNLWDGAGAQLATIDDFEFGVSNNDFVSGSALFTASPGLHPMAAARNLTPSAPRWGSGYKEWIAKNANSIAGMSTQLSMPTYEGNYLDLDPNQKDPLGIPVTRVTLDLREDERKALTFYRDRMAQLLKEMGASETFGADPRTVAPRPVATHAYGGTRAGNDPASSVVDKWGFAHDSPNFGVLGASTFACAGGRNPTETVYATAWRAAEYLAKNWGAITA